MKRIRLLLAIFPLAFSLTLLPAAVQPGEMFGYLLFDGERVPKEFNAGFSLYAAAWPLVDHYPGHDFQTGLLSTWMHPLYEPNQKPKEDCYIDIEGGLGWWRDTHFPTTTPKFIMGGVGPNFSVIANGPGYGAGTWKEERGLYGVAQLSPWLLFPLDGLNLKQGAQGELFGYGYLRWAIGEAAVLGRRHSPLLAAYHDRLEAQKGSFKANAIVANQLGRAIYFMLKNGTVFNIEQLLRHART